MNCYAGCGAGDCLCQILFCEKLIKSIVMFNYDVEDDIAMLCGCSLLAADSPCQSSQPGPGQSSVTPWSQEQDGKKLRLGLGRD